MSTSQAYDPGMTNLDADLGVWLAQKREEAGLSQEALAAQLGTEQPTISKIERGQRRVTAGDLIQWSLVLDIGFDTVGEELADLANRYFSTRSLWRR